MMYGDAMKINISDDVAKKLQERVKGSKFKDVEEYVDFVLKKVVKKLEEKRMTKQDEDKVKQRLRSLGYLD